MYFRINPCSPKMLIPNIGKASYKTQESKHKRVVSAKTAPANVTEQYHRNYQLFTKRSTSKSSSQRRWLGRPIVFWSVSAQINCSPCQPCSRYDSLSTIYCPQYTLLSLYWLHPGDMWSLGYRRAMRNMTDILAVSDQCLFWLQRK